MQEARALLKYALTKEDERVPAIRRSCKQYSANLAFVGVPEVIRRLRFREFTLKLMLQAPAVEQFYLTPAVAE